MEPRDLGNLWHVEDGHVKGVAQDVVEDVADDAPQDVAQDLAFGAPGGTRPPRHAITATAAFAQLASRLAEMGAQLFSSVAFGPG